MNRRDFIKLSALSTAYPAVCAAGNRRKPNIIILMADDIGWSNPSCMGSTFYETPNVDRIAAEGIVFTHAYSPANKCSPSRAATQTGIYPADLGIRRLKLPNYQSDCYLPNPLKENGYTTCHVGKWHAAPWSRMPKDVGYDHVRLAIKKGHQESLFWPYTKSGKVERKLDFPELVKNGSEGDYLTDKLGDAAIEFIEDNKSKPFFLNLCFYNVHVPVGTTDKYKKHFIDKIKRAAREVPTCNQSRVIKGSTDYNYLYAGAMKQMDDNIGRILDKLDELKIADDTFVIFVGENGTKMTVANSKPLREGKNSPYEGGMRMPMIARYSPMITPKSRTETPAILMDLFPTIMDMTGSSIPKAHKKRLGGVSLTEVFRNPNHKIARPLYWLMYPSTIQYTSMGKDEYCLPFESMVEGNWKLIHFRPCYLMNEHYELYNIEKDISEKNDLAKEMPEKVKDMAKKLADWQETTLVKNADYDPDEYSLQAMENARASRKKSKKEKK